MRWLDLLITWRAEFLEEGNEISCPIHCRRTSLS